MESRWKENMRKRSKKGQREMFIERMLANKTMEPEKE